jgi:hypothetical protein
MAILMKKLATALTITLGVACAATPIAHADGGWIAMAMSDSTGHISIDDVGESSQQAAEKKVMDACRKLVSDCRFLASGQGGCMALALAPAHTRYFGGWGPTSGEAEAAAIANSGGGTLQQGQDHCIGGSAS